MRRKFVTRSTLAIKKRISGLHLPCFFDRCSDLNQASRSDTRAGAGFFLPFLRIFDEFGPKRIEAALCWLDGMDGAATALKKMATAVLRDTETEKMPCPINEFSLKLLW